MVLEKPLDSPLDCKEIQPVHPNGDKSWVLIGTSNFEAETLILCPTEHLLVVQESSPTPQFKSINSSALSFLHHPNITSIRDYWKNHSLD